MKFFYATFFLFLLLACEETSTVTTEDQAQISSGVTLQILGTIQDAGSPHIGCQKKCCAALHETPDPDRMVISLGVYDAKSEQKFLFDATPDFTRQVKLLYQMGDAADPEVPNGIFITHAHIGHYTGLMYLGKEAINADSVPVYVMPRMEDYLRENGPWSQLVSRGNINLLPLSDEQSIQLSDQLKVTPLSVPHRGEFSETVGFRIEGPNRSVLFIPDIDKWELWDKDIVEEVRKVDFAFLDATFYSGAEVNHRDISQIPHPFIIESLDRFKALPTSEKEKITFIHFNHTNPVLDPDSDATRRVLEAGFNIGQVHSQYSL